MRGSFLTSHCQHRTSRWCTQRRRFPFTRFHSLVSRVYRRFYPADANSPVFHRTRLGLRAGHSQPCKCFGQPGRPCRSLLVLFRCPWAAPGAGAGRTRTGPGGALPAPTHVAQPRAFGGGPPALRQSERPLPFARANQRPRNARLNAVPGSLPRLRLTRRGRGCATTPNQRARQRLPTAH